MANSLRKTFSTVRKGFGSFHSDDIEQLIKQNLDLKKKFPLISAVTESQIKHGSEFGKFGRSARRLYFLEDQAVFINHGAFGLVPRILMNISAVWRMECEQQPLSFFDRYLFGLMAESLQSCAKFLNCFPSNLLPIQNVTSGLNSVMNSVELQTNDHVLCLSLTYGSTKKMLKDLCIRSKSELEILPLSLPIQSKDDVIKAISGAVRANTKLIILDQITSNTAMVLPVLEIAKECRKRNNSADMVIVVDAAHVIFNQHIDLSSTNIGNNNREQASAGGSSSSSNEEKEQKLGDVVDIWLTNAHKWMSNPKGCGFMWFSDRMRGHLRPAIISHGFQPNPEHSSGGSGDSGVDRDKYGRVLSPQHAAVNKVLSAYAWEGCRDYSPLLTFPSTLAFWQQYQSAPVAGIEGCRSYMHQLIREAEELLKEEWSLQEEDFAAPLEMRVNNAMTLIPLPQRVRMLNTRKEMTDNDAFRLQEMLHFKHNIEVPIKCLEAKLYARISAHIYNEIHDFMKLANVIKKL